MTPREERGMLLAATKRIVLKDGIWTVPSQTDNHRYSVRLDKEIPFCSCPDHKETGDRCKHIFAVEFTIRREQSEDGTFAETQTITLTKKKTYRQDWPNYNLGQTQERRHFLELLWDLCHSVPEPEAKPNPKGGRPSLPLRDQLFAACFKVYSLTSARRFNGELEEAKEEGYISHVPHFNSVLNVFNDKDVFPILKSMVERSALPLAAVETKFAVDSSGFAGTRHAQWVDEKYGKVKKQAVWVKAHVAVGVKTNVITAVEILEQSSPDCPQFPTLMETTGEGFRVEEASADKAYVSIKNFETVDKLGGNFFPAFKKSNTGGAGGLFGKAFHWFSFNQEDYLKRYHLRSNVESTFSAVKRKFGDGVRAKNDMAMKCEVLAKFICHNICCLIAEMYALGIDPSFEKAVQSTLAPVEVKMAVDDDFRFSD
jgi:transposase